MEYLIGGLIGGLIALIFRSKQENSLLKKQNAILRKEKEDRLFRITQTEIDIKSLKEKDDEQEIQIIHCLEWLSKMTKIKDEVGLHTIIVANRRFRELNKLSEDETETYISE